MADRYITRLLPPEEPSEPLSGSQGLGSPSHVPMDAVPIVLADGMGRRPIDSLPMNEALARQLDSMSEEEFSRVLEWHLELARVYDGPGGP